MRAKGTDTEYRAEISSRIAMLMSELDDLRKYVLETPIDTLTITPEQRVEYYKGHPYEPEQNPFSFTPAQEAEAEQTYFDMYK